jgi:hypothetical protein
VEKDTLRPLQITTHKKIIDCYSNKNASSQECEHCANNCTVPIRNAQNLIQNEMSQFQQKLQRCAMVCQDEVTSKYGGNPSEKDMPAAQKAANSCVSSCVDKHIAMLKAMQSKIESEIQSMVKKN